jgi:rubrerythrin
MFSMGDIIDLAIQIETNAESVYRNALKIISDPALISILRWLADEEFEHAKWFRQLKAMTQSEIKDPVVEAMGKSLLGDVLGRQSLQFIEDNETLDFLEKIIKEETHHIQELNRLVDRDDAEGKITTDLG